MHILTSHQNSQMRKATLRDSWNRREESSVIDRKTCKQTQKWNKNQLLKSTKVEAFLEINTLSRHSYVRFSCNTKHQFMLPFRTKMPRLRDDTKPQRLKLSDTPPQPIKKRAGIYCLSTTMPFKIKIESNKCLIDLYAESRLSCRIKINSHRNKTTTKVYDG